MIDYCWKIVQKYINPIYDIFAEIKESKTFFIYLKLKESYAFSKSISNKSPVFLLSFAYWIISNVVLTTSPI